MRGSARGGQGLARGLLAARTRPDCVGLAMLASAPRKDLEQRAQQPPAKANQP
jgi:hypothetical protein